MSLKPRWRLIFVPPRDGAENMARDLALQNYSRRTGECVFSVYSWVRPTLSFGRNQTARGLYDTALIEAGNIDVVRRPTGGRAILHSREVTYGVTGPDSFSPSLANTYDRINRLLVRGLQSLGVPAEIAAPGGAAPQPDETPCFAVPVKGELTARGRKLVGSAQFRENGAFLQHGSILIENDQDQLAMLASRHDRAETEPTPATLADLLARPVTPETLADALFAAVKEIEDELAVPMDETEIRADALALRPQFMDPLWTWRR